MEAALAGHRLAAKRWLACFSQMQHGCEIAPQKARNISLSGGSEPYQKRAVVVRRYAAKAFWQQSKRNWAGRPTCR
jgi:hypothetical protein